MWNEWELWKWVGEYGNEIGRWVGGMVEVVCLGLGGMCKSVKVCVV